MFQTKIRVPFLQSPLWCRFQALMEPRFVQMVNAIPGRKSRLTLLTICANRNRPFCRSFSSFSLNKKINISDWANIWNILFDFTDYALHFPTTGVSDYVDIWGMPSLTQFTACLWMKKNGTGSSNTLFCYGGAPGQSTGFLFGYNSWGFSHININNHGSGYIILCIYSPLWHIAIERSNMKNIFNVV